MICDWSNLDTGVFAVLKSVSSACERLARLAYLNLNTSKYHTFLKIDI